MEPIQGSKMEAKTVELEGSHDVGGGSQHSPVV
jgi:hypothetical protein